MVEGRGWYEGEARNRTLEGDVLEVIIRKTVVSGFQQGLR